MSLNIIDLIKGQLGPATISQAATQLGESESGISKAISGLLPAVVGGMANNASNPSVLSAITGAAGSGLLGNLIGGSSNNSLISTVLSSIFGDKIGGLVSSIAGYAGIGESSASSLLNMVTGATVGSVGKYATDNNLDASGITSLLGDQKGIVSSLLPAGLSLGTLGLGSLFGGSTPDLGNVKVSSFDTPKVDVNRGGASFNTSSSSSSDDNNGGGGSIWKWLLPLLLAGLVGFFVWNKCGKKDAGANPETTTTTTTDSTNTTTTSTDSANTATTTPAAPTKEATTVTLPDGTKLNAFKGGIEDQVVAFLGSDEFKSADEAALKNKWFNFDNLNFEFGTTTLTKESQVQLENLKKILAAYPEAKIKIGAYTDKKGDDAGNLKLSQKRADAVKTAINSAQVTGAEGYGEQFANVPETGTDKEREADRKTAIRFVK